MPEREPPPLEEPNPKKVKTELVAPNDCKAEDIIAIIIGPVLAWENYPLICNAYRAATTLHLRGVQKDKIILLIDDPRALLEKKGKPNELGHTSGSRNWYSNQFPLVPSAHPSDFVQLLEEKLVKGIKLSMESKTKLVIYIATQGGMVPYNFLGRVF
jgi:hypothetical protein